MHKFVLFATFLLPLHISSIAVGEIIFSDDFSVGSAGAVPAGWTFTDILTAGDHGSLGLRPNGSAAGGFTVNTRDGNDFFLNGGRSSVFSILVATIVPNVEYDFLVWRSRAGSSFNISDAFFSTSINGSPVATGVGTGQVDGTWSELQGTYIGLLADAGQDLWLNLESRRDISTAVVGWDDVEVTATPEPKSIVLLMLCGLCLLWFKGKKRFAPSITA